VVEEGVAGRDCDPLPLTHLHMISICLIAMTNYSLVIMLKYNGAGTRTSHMVTFISTFFAAI
jgi:hypothetical protein